MNPWRFLTRYEGEAPCNVPDWAWSAFGYKDGVLKLATSGPSEAEALRRARKMAAKIEGEKP